MKKMNMSDKEKLIAQYTKLKNKRVFSWKDTIKNNNIKIVTSDQIQMHMEFEIRELRNYIKQFKRLTTKIINYE